MPSSCLVVASGKNEFGAFISGGVWTATSTFDVAGSAVGDAGAGQHDRLEQLTSDGMYDASILPSCCLPALRRLPCNALPPPPPPPRSGLGLNVRCRRCVPFSTLHDVDNSIVFVQNPFLIPATSAVAACCLLFSAVSAAALVGRNGKLTLARRYLEDNDPRARWSLEQLLDHALQGEEAGSKLLWNSAILAVKPPKLSKKRPPSTAAPAPAPAAVAATAATAAAAASSTGNKRQKREVEVEVYYWNFLGRAGAVLRMLEEAKIPYVHKSSYSDMAKKCKSFARVCVRVCACGCVRARARVCVCVWSPF